MAVINMKQLASLLQTTMTNAGIMDDSNELMLDVFEYEGKTAAKNYGKEIDNGLCFINQQLGTEYEMFGEKEYQKLIK